MATPITHIVLTEKVYDKHFSHLAKDEFFIGTSFPDIRHLGVIAREKTHFNNVSLEDIKKETPFMAGVKFHSLLDEVRERFIVSKGVYEEMPESQYRISALKLLEDKRLYTRVTSWEEYRSYFENILDEALTMGVTANDLQRWNSILIKYFAAKPNEESFTQFVQGMGKPLEKVRELNSYIAEISENEKVLSTIDELYESFEELVSDKILV